MIKARSLALKAKKYNVKPTDKTPTIVTTHKRIMPPLNKKWKGYVVATEIAKAISRHLADVPAGGQVSAPAVCNTGGRCGLYYVQPVL